MIKTILIIVLSVTFFGVLFLYIYQSKINQIKFSQSIEGADPVYWFVVIYVNDKKKLKKFLQKK